jgi:cation transport regulator ChaB
MARVRKPQPTLDALFFATPQQRVLRLLLAEPTTAFTPRVISSKLKGVRGLGGSEGIQKILQELEELGLAEYVDNRRAARLSDENSGVRILKTLGSLCDLEGLKRLLEPISNRIVLVGSRSNGKARSDSGYGLCVISDLPEEVRKVASRHPLSRALQVFVYTPTDFAAIDRRDQSLKESVEHGIVLWGSAW